MSSEKSPAPPSLPPLLIDETTETRNKARVAILELTNMISVPMALNAIVRLKVPSIIYSNGKNSPVTASEVARKISPAADPENLQRLLRILSSYNVFIEHLNEQNNDRSYSLSEIGCTLVENEEGLSYGEYVLQHYQEALVRAWPLVDHAVVGAKAGEGMPPFEVANGEGAYEYYGKNDEVNKLMQRAMAGVSVPFMKAIINGGYDGFGDDGNGVKKLVDVGGSGGDCLKMIMNKFKGIEIGINFDLPEVVAKAPPIPGITHVGGDMFKSVPSGDAIFMKWVLTTWSDEDIIRILKNCYKALPEGGKVIACEPVLPETTDKSHRTRALLSGDIFVMTIYGARGKHRTEGEYTKLGITAGFPRFKAIYIDYFFTILEFLK